MSYNQNFYNNFRANNFTFQPNLMAPNFVPPPPAPPQFFIPPIAIPPVAKESDQDFVKKVEKCLPQVQNSEKFKSASISQIREELRNLVTTLNNMKQKEQYLSDNINTISQDTWDSVMKEIEQDKSTISICMSEINDSRLEVLRKLIAKRSAKRMRLKRLRLEMKSEKEDRIKQLEEKSRKIDENLQKIKDDIIKAKQDEEAKLQADVVLKEVLRKKSDAKKCLVKLDALIKLRKARQNTAKGRGENLHEGDAIEFNNKIEKLKALWTQKQALYDKEEAGLRQKLNQDQVPLPNQRAEQVLENWAKWRECLFGNVTTPQVDFGGDIGRFVAVRAQWDRFINVEGSPLPVGWVLPSVKK